MPALLMGSASCLRGNVPPVPIRLVAYAMGPSCPGAAMSEEWPNGWYRDEQGRQARPGFTPRQDALGSPYEPTQAVPPGGPRGRTSRRRAAGPVTADRRGCEGREAGDLQREQDQRAL